MVNINKLFMTIIVTCVIMIIPNNVIIANASTTLPYKDVEGVQCVNIVELAKLKGGQVSEATHEVYGNGYNITIDGKLVTIYEEAPYIFIDGTITTLKSETISADGKDFKFPVMQTPAKDGNDFLIPMYVIENNLGIKGDKEGIVIEAPKEEDKEDTNTGDSNSDNGSDNSDSSNNGGNSDSSNNGGNNGGNGNNNGNGGGTTPKPEEPKPEPPKPVEPEEPKPEPPKPEEPQKPSGMDFNTFASKLPSLGFEDNAYWDNGRKMGRVYVDSSQAGFTLENNSATFNNVITNCFNMLLPTQGNRLYSIVSNPFSNQTLEMDGRLVEITQYPQGVGVIIKNK